MAKIYEIQNQKIKAIIEALQGDTADKDDVLDVIEVLLTRMEYKQKEKLCVTAILEEYFSK